MPLSEEELRLLDQMERALVAEDPRLASTLRGTAQRRTARRRTYLAAGAFLVAIGVLFTGAVIGETVVGILGFLVMLASAYVGLTSWRAQSQAPAADPARAVAGGATAYGMTMINGGKTRRRQPRSSGSGSGSTFMSRFEERWRRRRDSGGQ